MVLADQLRLRNLVRLVSGFDGHRFLVYIAYQFKPTMADFLILLVDDDPDLGDWLSRVAVRSFPEARFHQVLTTPAAKAYIQELDGFGPRLILLDINLEHTESGFDFLAYLRAHPQAFMVPALILTVSKEKSDLEQAYAAKANAYMVKPDTLDAWTAFLDSLREYWVNTVTLPPIRFTRGAN